MQGVVPRQASDLNSRLRRSLAWTSTAKGSVDPHRYHRHHLSGSTTTATSVLHDRLDEVLVLELLKDGGRHYLTLSVRGLYKHVLAAITAPPPEEIQSLNVTNSIQQDTIPEDKPLVTEDLPLPGNDLPVVDEPNASSITSMATTRAVPNVMLGSLLPPGDSSQNEDSNDSNQNDGEEETEIIFQSDDPSTYQVSTEQHSSPQENAKEATTTSFQSTAASPPGQGHRFQSNLTSSGRPNLSGVGHQPLRSKSAYNISSKPSDSASSTTMVTGQAGEAAVTYRERLGGYLHPRDMRRLVTPFSASNEPDLIVRRHAMLLNFDPLRAIILRDRLLVLIPDGADSMLVDLERRVRGGSKEMEAHIFGLATNEMDSLSNSTHSSNAPTAVPNGNGNNIQTKEATKKSSIINRVIQKTPLLARQHTSDDSDNSSKPKKKKKKEDTKKKVAPDDRSTAATSEEFDHPHYQSEWEDLKGKEWIQLPFELQCADAVLQTVVGLLQEDTHELQMATLDYIEEIIPPSHRRRGYREDPLTIIRAVKDSVREMTARVKGFVKSMNDTLDDYEDMALMNLSRLITVPERFIQPVPQEVLEEESDEPELILESYLQHAMSVMNVLDLIQGQIDTAAELVDQKLDATRNKILLANTLITLTAFCIQCATLVAGFLGMNLTNHMEESENAFNKVTYWTLAATVILFFLLMYIMQRTETMPGWNSVSAGGF